MPPYPDWTNLIAKYFLFQHAGAFYRFSYRAQKAEDYLYVFNNKLHDYPDGDLKRVGNTKDCFRIVGKEGAQADKQE